MRFPRPKTIRGQLIASLVLFELLALLFFTGVLADERGAEQHARILRRLEAQTSSLSEISSLALKRNDLELLHAAVQSMLRFPTIHSVNVTDLRGQTLAATDPALTGRSNLSPGESSYLGRVHGYKVIGGNRQRTEAVWPVWVNGQIVAYLWVHGVRDSAYEDRELIRACLLGGSAVLMACTLLATMIAGTLTQPLERLLAATRSLIQNPEDLSAFPLPVQGSHEAANLTGAFNRMVAASEEQRRGLNDTVALLDSMLANAPVGLAFFDKNGRFVRVNRFLAEVGGLEGPVVLGRRIHEVFAPGAASMLDAAVRAVFEEGKTVPGLELAGAGLLAPANGNGGAGTPSTWMANFYPVRTATQGTRWAGMVMVDMSERLRVEHALRETEKLAMAGRLAASIAHEINNPLEAVTNLLYLLRHHGSVGQAEGEWIEAAQHEVARVSAITQQTLRFHRQSTRPLLASISELIDSVITLHQGRFATLSVHLERRYRDTGELFCYAGELRQLFANLVGNALDAMMGHDGGRLIVCVRQSRSWKDPGVPGVRLVVADTGCGMSPAVRKRIFEPFYTTKEATGTGLGLWVGAEIMAKHQVALHIRSRERGVNGTGRPGGTVFMLFFPVVSAFAPAAAQPEAARV